MVDIKRLQNILKKKRQLVLWFCSYLIVVLVSVVINTIGYTGAIDAMQQEVADVNSGAMQQMQISYDNYFQDLKNSSYQLIYSNEAQILSRLTLDHAREVELLKSVISNIGLCNSSKEWVTTTEIIFQDKDICVDMGAKYTKDLLYQMRYSDFYSSKDAWLNEMFAPAVSSYKLLTDKNGNKRFLYLFTSPVIGKKPIVVVSELNQKVMKQYLSKMADVNGGKAMIVNQAGEILFANDETQELLNLNLNGESGTAVKSYHGHKYVVNYCRSELLKDVYYIQMIENSVYIGKINATRNLFLFSFLLCICVGAGLAYFFARANYRPVKRLLHVIPGDKSAEGEEFRYIEEQLLAMTKNRSRIEKEISKQKNVIKSTFLSKLLSGKIRMDEKNSRYLSEYSIDLSGVSSAVVLFNIMELGVVEDESGAADWEGYKTVHFVISNIFGELMAPYANVYFCEMEDMYAAVVNFISETNGNALIAEKVEYANSFLHEHLQMEFVCGISSVDKDISNLTTLYQQAYEMITYRFLTDDKHIFVYNDMMSRTDIYQYTEDMSRHLQQLIASGNGKQATEYVRYVVDTNLSDKQINLDMLRILISELTSTVLKQTIELESTKELDTRLVCRLPSDLNEFGKLEGVLDELCKFIMLLSSLYAGNTKNMVDSRCENIKKYIETHYDDPDLNVSSVASAFGLSMSYLSSYFKEQMSEGLAEYIVKCRVKKAKERLRNTDETIAVIAEKVGFCSSNVFIRAFKKVTSVTPGQYKSMIKKN